MREGINLRRRKTAATPPTGNIGRIRRLYIMHPGRRVDLVSVGRRNLAHLPSCDVRQLDNVHQLVVGRFAQIQPAKSR